MEDAKLTCLQAQNQAHYSKESVVSSELFIDLVLIQYKEGTTDYTRLLLVQQDQLILAPGNILTNPTTMYRALGGGWRLREGNEATK